MHNQPLEIEIILYASVVKMLNCFSFYSFQQFYLHFFWMRYKNRRVWIYPFLEIFAPTCRYLISLGLLVPSPKILVQNIFRKIFSYRACLQLNSHIVVEPGNLINLHQVPTSFRSIEIVLYFYIKLPQRSTTIYWIGSKRRYSCFAQVFHHRLLQSHLKDLWNFWLMA